MSQPLRTHPTRPWKAIPALAPADAQLSIIAEMAKGGSFDGLVLDHLLTEMVEGLRATHNGRNLDDALAEASRVLAFLDQVAAKEFAAQKNYHFPVTIEMVIAQRAYAKRAAFVRSATQAAAPTPTQLDDQSDLFARASAATPDLFVLDAPSVEPVDASNSPLKEPLRAQERGMGALDGRRLGRSIFPTWCGLVFFSLIALFWGGLVSAPMGVGAAVLLSVPLGLVAVPLWASIFGFIGMRWAKNQTLESMGFQPCPPDHPLVESAMIMSQALGIPTPQMGTMDKFNAFAVGQGIDHASVVMGIPLMGALTEEETEAVLGHELGHIVSGDMRSMMLMRTFQNATVWFACAQGLKQAARWAICWASELYILKCSREREYYADAIGAALTSKEAMIGVLQKLDKGPPLTREENTHARFMMRGRSLKKWLSTHPTSEQRIEALKSETYLSRLPRMR